MRFIEEERFIPAPPTPARKGRGSPHLYAPLFLKERIPSPRSPKATVRDGAGGGVGTRR